MERLKRRVYNDRWSAVKDEVREKEREERTLCLYECLRAAGLQQHYARFTSMGVCRAAHLSALTMEDYPILGINTMEDRTRLFHLVQIIKTDLQSLEHNDDYDDKGYTVVDSSFTYDAYRDPHEDAYNDEEDNGAVVNNMTAALSCVRRQLDFSCENTDHQNLVCHRKGTVHTYESHNRTHGPVQGKMSTIPVQLELESRNAVVCASKGNNNHRTDLRSHLSDHRTRENTEPDNTGSISLYNSHTRLSSTCVSFHKPKPRPATVTSKRLNNKPRKGISRKEKLWTDRDSYGTSRHTSKPKPVYESQRTAGYNYGLPQSSLPALNKRRAGDQRISVCVRKRPLTHAESRKGEADVVTTPGGECVIVHEGKEAVDLTQYILQHRFYFDQVFGEDSSNEEVYQRTAYPLVQHMLSGGKATCFAYGQTGAGKTHTMLGSSPRRPGLYALAVRDIFAHLSDTHTYSRLLVYVSFFEIYRGQLYDLLDHRKRLFAREDGQKVVHIAGLRDVRVDSVSSLLEVISQGMGVRTQGMSGVNPLSSRSHALLQIQLRGPNQHIAGRMWFVDLAGSERASDTKEPDRQSRMEGAEINQSLLALKECIRSLDQEQSHTPFRQSKLTQVLKDSFVGDSMTCMIANISPGHLATEHTLNTLRYADRVKELRRQGAVRGGRRGKTLPSPKHNLSYSNSSGGTRGKSPPKKAKLGRQREEFGPTSPTTMMPTGEAILCSTPKNSTWGEETSPRGIKSIGLEHITPVRGWLGTVDKREMMERRGEQKDRGRENKRTDSHSVTRAGLVLGQTTSEGVVPKGNLSFTRRKSVFSHREKEQNQQSTMKVEKEGGRKWIERQRQVKSSRATCREVEMQNDRHVKKADEKDKEKERHLRWYHEQLQQFMPSSGHLLSPSSSNQASLCSPVSPSSCSSLQQSPPLSLSALMYHSLEQTDDNRGPFPCPSDELCLQNETSSSYRNNNDENARGGSDGLGGDWRLHRERTGARLGQHMGEREKREPVKTTGEARARKDDKRTAGVEGGERRWAWLATETKHPHRMTGAVQNNVEAQVLHNCDPEPEREVDEEGLTASDVPADGLWGTEEGGGADSCSLVNAYSNDSNSLLNHSSFESPHQRAPAERPFSPTCEHINILLTPESKHTRCNVLTLQNTSQAGSSSSCREKEQWVATDANRQFSNAPSTTQPLTMSITQTECKKSAKPLNKCGHTPEVKLKMSVLPQDETYADSLSCIMDPLSVSLLQLDQQVATASFLQGDQDKTSVSLEKNNTGEDSRWKVEEDNLTCSEMMGNEEPLLELLQSKTQCPLIPDTVTVINHTEQRKEMCCAKYEHCGMGKEKHHIPEVNSGSSSSNNLSPNCAVQLPPQHAHKMYSKRALAISTQQAQSVMGHLNTVPTQCHTVHSHHVRDSNCSLKPNSPTQSKSQESTSNQQIRPIIHLSTLKDMDHAQRSVVRAHCEQREEMEVLCHKEGVLLCQQPDMAFREYIQKLEDIMERKAQCVHSMRAQLQPYLMTSHLSQSHNHGDHNNDSQI